MDHVMTPSWRKPVGMLLILLAIALWCAVIVSFSATVSGWHWALQSLFYTIAGIVWITPMKPLLRWMELGRWR
jgi:hypothetical protein